MIQQIEFDDGTKTFSVFAPKGSVTTPIKGSKFGELLKVMGAAAVINLSAAAIKIASRRYGNKTKDRLLESRNDRINRLSDQYKEGTAVTEMTPALVKKYKDEISSLYEETLQVNKTRTSDRNDGDLYITVNQDQYGGTRSVNKAPVERGTILEQYINPFFVVLRMILINQVHILAGTTMGAARRNFELVYDSSGKNADDLARDQFRETIFKYPWPSHGYEVSTRGEVDANKFINSTIDFLANNPKFLAIRVKS